MKKSSKDKSNKKAFKGREKNLHQLGQPKTLLKARSSTLLYPTLSVLGMGSKKEQKSPSEKRSSKNNWTKKEDYKTSPWNPLSQNQFPNMWRRIFTKKSWENKKGNANNDSTDLESKFRKACTPFLPIFFQNQNLSPFTNSPNPITNLSLNPCPGIAKSIYLKEFKKKKINEGKEFLSK